MKRSIATAIAVCWLGGSGWSLAQTEGVGLRQIVVRSSGEAAEIRAQVLAGVSFEALARTRSVDPSSAAGGYLGRVVVSDLRQELQEALADLGPDQVSPVINLAGQYLLLQIVSEAEEDWIAQNAAGFEAYQQGLYAEAVESFSAAIRQAEAFGPEDYRLVQSLSNLAEFHRLQGNFAEAELLFRRAVPIWEHIFGPADLNLAQHLNSLALVLHAQEKYGEAEPFYRRSLTIREEALGLDHPDVATSLNNLAELYRLQRDFAAAEPLYRRSLAILEEAFGPDHPGVETSRNNLRVFQQALIEEVSDRLSTLLSFAGFRDERFDAALAEYNALTPLARLDRESYLSMADLLVSEGLAAEGEALLLLAVESFPDSRELRYRLAEQVVTSGKYTEGLELFRQASEMEGAADLEPAVDGQRRALIYRRIGDLEAHFTEYEVAEALYERSLEIDPDNVDSRLALGEMYFRVNRLEEALDQYAVAAELAAQNYVVHLGLAEINLAMRRYEEAEAAAAAAFRIDPMALRPRFLRGTAWVRLGRIEEGRAELQEYARLEAESQAAEHQAREVAAINRDAMATLRRGEPEGALTLFLSGVESYPEEAQLYVNLAHTQSRLGRHEEAVETFLAVIDLGISDDFRIHRNLAEEYEILGDLEASTRHRAIYLEERDAELSGPPE